MSSRVDGDDGGAKPSATKLLKTFSKCRIYETKKIIATHFLFLKKCHQQNLEVTLGKKRRRMEACIADAEVLPFLWS